MSSSPNPSRILIVEDDIVVREIIARHLQRDGFEAIEADSIANGERLFAERDIDLVIADINLPDGAGFDLVATMRRTRDVPVIYVTTRDASADRVHGLESGGDDYVIKPVDPDELQARIRAVLRRYNRPDQRLAQPESVVAFAGWTVDLVRRELADPKGEVVNLTRAEFDLFAALMQTKAILSRDYLLEVVSSTNTTAKLRTIDVLVSRVRRKLAAAPGPAPRLVTVSGEGYRLDVPS
jgi:two-component system OmpR family response regulator